MLAPILIVEVLQHLFGTYLNAPSPTIPLNYQKKIEKLLYAKNKSKLNKSKSIYKIQQRI
jgi:hypothetical protein